MNTDYDNDLHTAWSERMLDLVHDYHIADTDAEIRDAWQAIREHISAVPANLDLTMPELRTGTALQHNSAIRTVAVVLGDNDFGYTFMHLLESLHQAAVWRGGLTKETADTAVRAGIEYHFMAFQHKTGRGESDTRAIKAVVEYLNNGIKVLFDEDAEADICQQDHDGGAWYLELASGNVAAY